MLSEGIVVYFDPQLSRELEEREDFEELGMEGAIRLETLGVVGLAVLLAIDWSGTGVFAAGVLAVGVSAVGVSAVGVSADGNLAIRVLAANDLGPGSLAVDVLAVGVFCLQGTFLNTLLHHPGVFQSSPRQLR